MPKNTETNLYFIGDLPSTRDHFLSVLSGYTNPDRPEVTKNTVDKYGLRPHTFWHRLPQRGRASFYSYQRIKRIVSQSDSGKESVVYNILIEWHPPANGFDYPAAKAKLDRAKYQHYSVRWGSEAAEMRQNLTIVRDAINLCVSAYKAFARGDISKVARLLKVSSSAIASPYLFYQFGIKPILLLIVDACNDLEKDFVKQSLHLHSARSRVWKEHKWTETVRIIDSRFPDPLDVTINCAYKTIAGYNSDSLRQPAIPADFSELLNYFNPILIAWELVPYSFIADYFLGVSDFLGAYNRDYDVSEIYNSTYAGWHYDSSAVVINGESASTLLGTYHYHIDHGQVPSGTISSISDETSSFLFFTRTPTAVPPSSSLRFNIDLNTSQLLATGAVLLQRLANIKI